MENIKLKRLAFTLSEVLITLGIIGVIAAITVPGLVGNYEKRLSETGLKNAYNKIMSTVEHSVANGASFKGYDGASDTVSKKFYNRFFANTLQVTKFCEKGVTGCWGTSTSLGGSSDKSYSDGVSFTLNDGTSFLIVPVTKTVLQNKYKIYSAQNNVVIYIDSNGHETLPNALGQDVFVVGWNGEKLVPAGVGASKQEMDNSCKSSGNGYLCMQKIILNGWSIPKDVWER